jgi:hypothetical protein
MSAFPAEPIRDHGVHGLLFEGRHGADDENSGSTVAGDGTEDYVVLIFGIFASIAEFERELIRGRVRSGLAHVRAKGKRLGRPRASAIVDQAKVRELRAAGVSWCSTAKQLQVSLRTLRREASGFELAWNNSRPLTHTRPRRG